MSNPSSDQKTVGWIERSSKEKEYFQVPVVYSTIARIFHNKGSSTVFDWLTGISVGITVVLFFKGKISKRASICIFVIWRLAYNVGLGYLLRRQSSSKYIVECMRKRGFGKKHKKGEHRSKFVDIALRQAKSMIVCKDKEDLDNIPVDFLVWVLFCGLVDVILVNGLVSYIIFSLLHVKPLENGALFLDYLRYAGGMAILLLNLWVKLNAHSIVKDYAWYWGDFFFRIDESLVFDGVFELAPHPMYSLGYIGYYGSVLITKSYSVLFISLLAHAGQLLFLAYVENPHIGKTYGDPIAELEGDSQRGEALVKFFGSESRNVVLPSFSEGHSIISVVMYVQILAISIFLGNSSRSKSFFVFQSIFWFIARTLGVGIILWLQAKNNFWMKAFKNMKKSEAESFKYWRLIYDLVHTESYICFVICCFKFIDKSQIRFDGSFVTRVVLGGILAGLEVWTIKEALEVITVAGWYYGDFFSDSLRLKNGLTYTGIYRYFNDPLMIMSSLMGAALISNSKVCYAILAAAQIGVVLLSRFVERPYLYKLYRGTVRSKGGAEKVILNEIEKLQVQTKKMLDSIVSELEHTYNLESIKKRVNPTGKVFADNAKSPEKLLRKNINILKTYINNNAIGISKNKLVKELILLIESKKKNLKKIENSMKALLFEQYQNQSEDSSASSEGPQNDTSALLSEKNSNASHETSELSASGDEAKFTENLRQRK